MPDRKHKPAKLNFDLVEPKTEIDKIDLPKFELSKHGGLKINTYYDDRNKWNPKHGFHYKTAAAFHSKHLR